MPSKVCPQCGAEYELNQKFCSNDGATLRSDTAAALEGAVIAGRYRILRRLGEGGMGQVYLAEHLRMKRRDALKVMQPRLAEDPAAVQRFNREAMNASRIDHPNVAAIYDFGDAEDGLVFLAMEYIDGQSLDAILTQGAMAPERAAAIIDQVSDALSAAHDLGIIHRDLKPQNIMIGKGRHGEDMVKLVDFGISKIAGADEQKVTKSGAQVGSPAFMSPEQVANDPIDKRSDIYSLGIVAFTMLTGKLPFEGEGTDIMWARVLDQALRLSEVRPDVVWGSQLEFVMDRVLARNPADRFETAPQFAVAFKDAIQKIPKPVVRGGSSTVILAPTVPVRSRRLVTIGAVSAGLAAGVTAVLFAWSPAKNDNPAPTSSAPSKPPEVRQAATEVPPKSVSTDTGAHRSPPAATKNQSPGSATTQKSPTTTQQVRYSLPKATLLLQPLNLSGAARAQFDSALTKVPRAAVLVDRSAGTPHLMIEANPAGLLIARNPTQARGLDRADTVKNTDLLTGLLRREVAALDLAALDKPTPSGVTLESLAPSHDFIEDDALQFRVTSKRGGYVTLVDIGAGGVATVLYPTGGDSVQPLPINGQFALPDFAAGGPFGLGRVRAIVTSAPLKLPTNGDVMYSATDGSQLTEIILSQLETIVRGGGWWETSGFSYTVVPKKKK
jgi:serine/threonine-protein kinase